MKGLKGFTVLMFVCGFMACQSKSVVGGKIVVLDEENFSEKVLESNGAFLVDFYAAWCPPCKMQEPVIEEIAEEFEGKMGVGKVNVDKSRALASQYGIRSIPTLIIFNDGKQVEKISGFQKKNELVNRISKYVAEDNNQASSGSGMLTGGKVLFLNDSVFDKYVLEYEGIVLVDFYADRRQNFAIEDIARIYADEIIAARVNVDKSKKLVSRYRIKSIPTLIIFKNGKVIEKMAGIYSKNQFEEKIKKQLSDLTEITFSKE